ncbi:hypothetical protein QVD17_05866 [Tagetes erecta]|uniref:Reverse transcriptase zinc-binding domain-containing protein n=1 Tax=Tagetes erecta TaxID=13708 RepID=A0AAD8PBU6_TARER|nr:hypothetical protein QVD17_05866 [Tagetes erecta]
MANLARFLRCFHLASGLKVSFKKSMLYGIGIRATEMDALARRLHCKSGKFPFIYLGVSVGSNMGLVRNWKVVIEKVRRKVELGMFDEIENGISWTNLVPLKANFFAWCAWLGRIATKDNLAKRGVAIDTLCGECQHMVESAQNAQIFVGKKKSADDISQQTKPPNFRSIVTAKSNVHREVKHLHQKMPNSESKLVSMIKKLSETPKEPFNLVKRLRDRTFFRNLSDPKPLLPSVIVLG